MLKKILTGTLIAIVIYFATGIALLAGGKIHRLYFFPGYSIKKGRERDFDQSGRSNEGPLIIYRKPYAVAYGLNKRVNTFSGYADTVVDHQAQEFTVQPNQLKPNFSFHLKGALRQEPDLYATPDKMLIISDIEGNLKGFLMILQGNKVVDSKLNWAFGKGHLILNGDFFDRGLDVTACLWYIYKLEQEAERAGGKVHFILGNHEIMNLTGNYKYVRNQYLKNAEALHIPYGHWYNTQTELGRWLRTKNVMEKIGPIIYTHGGISPQLLALRLPMNVINRVAAEYIDKPKPPAANRVAHLIAASPNSPYWYRGMAQQEMSEPEVKQALNQYRASQIVIGHTMTGGIKTFYHGQVITIDLPHQENSDKGIMQALGYEKGNFYITDEHARRAPLP